MDLQTLQAKWEWALTQGDPRVKDWPLMNANHVAIIALSYLIGIFLLKAIMSRVETPFKLKTFALLHNANLTFLSLYMGCEIIRQAWINNYSLFGNGVDTTEKGAGMARVLWIFYASKILEFIDTIIMALKKNFHQISFLHLYHHSSIFVVWWVIIYYAPGGESYFSAMLNSFIHVIMYGYYLWSTLAPKADPTRKPRFYEPAFYRPYITRAQMTQFMIMFIQATYNILVPNPFPRFCAWILFFYMMTMLGLFGNFYVQAYMKGGSKKKAKEAEKAAHANGNGTTNGHANGHKNGHSSNGNAHKTE